MSMAFTPRKPRELEIVKKGNPILYEVAQEVKNVQNNNIQTLISDMLLTCEKAGGAGLAAPQIGKSLRIIIVAPKNKKPVVMINPIVAIHAMSKLKSGDEGSLSIPGVTKEIMRHNRIKVSFLDQDGKPQNEIFSNFDARIIQHTVDNLNGKLIA